MKLSAALLLLSVIAGGNALAHSDRLLPIRPDGTMPALPSKFGPANLKIKFSAARSDTTPITSVVLKLGENRIELPACITDRLRSRRLEEVEATASWYHNEVDLPYYLNLNFFDPGYSAKNGRIRGFGCSLIYERGK